MKLEAKMVMPIGTAVFSPAIPTSGAVMEPSMKGKSPSKAAALPAICPCSCIASENDDVEMIPMEDTKKNNGITMVMSGPWSSTASKRKMLAVLDIPKPICRKRVSEIRSVNRPTSCVPIIIPIPFMPNSRLNV